MTGKFEYKVKKVPANDSCSELESVLNTMDSEGYLIHSIHIIESGTAWPWATIVWYKSKSSEEGIDI